MPSQDTAEGANAQAQHCDVQRWVSRRRHRSRPVLQLLDKELICLLFAFSQPQFKTWMEHGLD